LYETPIKSVTPDRPLLNNAYIVIYAKQNI